MHQATVSTKRTSEGFGDSAVNEATPSVDVAGTADVKRTMGRIVNDHQFWMVEKMLEVVRTPVVHAECVCAGDELATGDLGFGVSVGERLEQKEILAGIAEPLQFVAVGFIERFPPLIRVANEFRWEAVNESGWE